MPDLNTANVAAAKPYGGGIYWAPLGTALPTNESAALAAAYKPLGYLSDAGLQPNSDVSEDKKKAWGGDIVAKLVTDESRSFEFTLIEEFSVEVNKFVYGAENVTVTPATSSAGQKIAVADVGGKRDNCVLVFDMKHGSKRRRVVVPVADYSKTGEGAWVDGEVMSYTISAEAIKDGAGKRVYDYKDDGVKTA